MRIRKTLPPPHLPGREGLVAELAVHGLLAGVELLDMQPEVRLPSARGGAQLAVVHRLVPGIYGQAINQSIKPAPRLAY
jgi:hypothetical protein